jgi:hypothetical protein
MDLLPKTLTMKIFEVSGEGGYLFLLISGINFDKIRTRYKEARTIIATTFRQKENFPSMK